MMANPPLLTSQQRKINKLEARIAQLECIIHTLTDPNSRILRNLELAIVLDDEFSKPHKIIPETFKRMVSQRLMVLRSK
ncbi:hypothetical protein LCGC14_1205670 [marine sediment metagenome]|uniref:Uncharacterized protein n=1 Tax=marine sediment metagenome TaxID=412755 RepID=A0A0F9M305_9ZZZZ